MSVKRILTTVIGLPIVVIVLIFANKYIIDVIIALMAIIAMNEYIKCVSKKTKVISWISYLSVAGIALIHVIPENIINQYLPFAIPSLMLILFLHIIISNMKITFENISYTLIGILYIFSFMVFFPLIYGTTISNISGKILIWFVLCSAWGTDIWAYLIGRKFGKTKFSKVSPNKSVQGCIAGILGALCFNLIFTFVLNTYFEYEISYYIIGAITIVLSICSQIGDFTASSIKRYFDIKDFSQLFPGHGGMLDRIDSVMFIAPFAYLLFINLL